MVREVLASMRRIPGLPVKVSWFRGPRRTEDQGRTRWRAVWEVHVELSCRLPLASPHALADYADVDLHDDAEAVLRALAVLVSAGPAPQLREAAEHAQAALLPVPSLEDRQALLDTLTAAVPSLQRLNDGLRAYLGSDVIIPEGPWHGTPPR